MYNVDGLDSLCFLYGKAYLALSGLDIAITKKARSLDSTALEVALNTQFLFQIRVFTVVPMIMGFILEQGLLKAIGFVEKMFKDFFFHGFGILLE